MSDRIVTKPRQKGDENEGTWPSEFGTREVGVWHIDPEKGVQKGYPPRRTNKFGQAPMYISDEIKPYRHPRTGKVVTSKSALMRMDRDVGTITTHVAEGLDPDATSYKEDQYQIKRDRSETLRKAVELVDSGNAPLSEETKAKCALMNENLSKALNFDAFNVAGNKNDERGKQFRSN